jgi:hypothetical protein
MMDKKQINDVVAKIMGIKSGEVLFVQVKKSMVSDNGWEVALVIKPTPKQVAKLKEFLLKV